MLNLRSAFIVKSKRRCSGRSHAFDLCGEACIARRSPCEALILILYADRLVSRAGTGTTQEREAALLRLIRAGYQNDHSLALSSSFTDPKSEDIRIGIVSLFCVDHGSRQNDRRDLSIYEFPDRIPDSLFIEHFKKLF